MLQVIPPISYSDFEKVLDVLPEQFHATVRIFCWDSEKSFGTDYSADTIILRMESPTKSKILALVKDYFDREGDRPRCRKIEEGEEIVATPEQKNIFTLEKATWYIEDNTGGNLRIELCQYRIEIYYSNPESAILAKELFNKLYTIPSLGIKLFKHEWRHR